MIIKLLLLVALGFSALYAYRAPTTGSTLALRRSLGLLALAAAAATIVRPDLATRVAHLVGVGRGTDLVLYTAVVVGVWVGIGLYRRIHELELTLERLTRAIAIDDALKHADQPALGENAG